MQKEREVSNGRGWTRGLLDRMVRSLGARRPDRKDAHVLSFPSTHTGANHTKKFRSESRNYCKIQRTDPVSCGNCNMFKSEDK
jgi:hypothetical protein